MVRQTGPSPINSTGPVVIVLHLLLLLLLLLGMIVVEVLRVR